MQNLMSDKELRMVSGGDALSDRAASIHEKAGSLNPSFNIDPYEQEKQTAEETREAERTEAKGRIPKDATKNAAVAAINSLYH